MSTVKRSVLIIEDHQDIRESTEEILLLADYTVYTADNGKKGIEIALTQLPDVILCDIMMPELDGYETLEVLSKNNQTAGIPFIFMTAKAERSDMRKGMELGADDYLTKPFTDSELLSAIGSRLSKSDQAKQLNNNSALLEGLLNEAHAVKLLNKLSENSRLRSYKKKQAIFQEGDHALHVYFVKSGSVRTYLVYEDGREISSGIYAQGDFFGYESVLLNKVHAENAETLETTDLHLINREDFNTLLFKNVGIAKKFIELLSGNIQDKQDQLLKLAYDTVRKRVADALVTLAEKFDTTGCADTATLKISRDDLAAIAATATETISRVLADLKDENLIDREGTKIKIPSIQQLKKARQ